MTIKIENKDTRIRQFKIMLRRGTATLAAASIIFASCGRNENNTVKPAANVETAHASILAQGRAGIAVAEDFSSDIPTKYRPDGVSCEYRMPTGNARDPLGVVGVWAGIGGLPGTTIFPDNTQLIQIGTAYNALAYKANATYGWYETIPPAKDLPNHEQRISDFRVDAGDLIIAEVKNLGGSDWQLRLEDLSKTAPNNAPETFVKNVVFNYRNTSAECIVENPESNVATHLLDVGTVKFINASMMLNGKNVPFDKANLIAKVVDHYMTVTEPKDSGFVVSYTGPGITSSLTDKVLIMPGKTVSIDRYGFYIKNIVVVDNKPAVVLGMLYNGTWIGNFPSLSTGKSEVAGLNNGTEIYVHIYSINMQEKSVIAQFAEVNTSASTSK